MKNKNTKLYIDDETITFEQAVTNIVNVTFRGVSTTSSDMLEAHLCDLESLDRKNYTEKQIEYLSLAIKVAENRLQLSVDINELLLMARKKENAIDDITAVESFCCRSGEEVLSADSVNDWADKMLLANAKPKQYDEGDFYCDTDSLPSSAECVQIALASALQLLAKQEKFGDSGKPKISTLAKKLEEKGYGQTSENLRKVLKKALNIKGAYFNK